MSLQVWDACRSDFAGYQCDGDFFTADVFVVKEKFIYSAETRDEFDHATILCPDLMARSTQIEPTKFRIARPQRAAHLIYRVDVIRRFSELAAAKTHWGMIQMIRRLSKCLLAIVVLGFCCSIASEAKAQRAFGRSWGTASSARDWDRFYHYPYVYYPQNFWSKDYYRSSDSMYYRYPSEMRVPVYNKQWHNFYPAGRLYHRGHHFNLDVF